MTSLRLPWLVAAALAAAAPALAGSPPAAELWNGAAAGMNIDQVFALFPRAEPVTGQTLEDRSVQALALPAKIADTPARALFFFHFRSLDAVVVERQGLRRGEQRRNLAEADRLIALADREYGQPVRCTKRPDIAAVSCLWRANGLEVGLSYHDAGGGSPALSVAYRAAR